MASVAVAPSSAAAPSSALALSPGARRGLGIAGIWAATVAAPAVMLLGMPILFGPAHLANDVRYLILPLPRRQAVIAISACIALFGLQLVATATGSSLAAPQAAIVAAWFLASVGLGPTTRWRFALAAVVAAAIVWLPVLFIVIASAAHNVVALLAWRIVARPARRQLVATLAIVAGAAVLALLAGPAIAAWTGGDVTRWLSVDGAAASLFPGVAAGQGLMIAVAFLQAVHYAVWLAWIPADAPRRTSARATLAALGATAVLVAVALVDAAWARATYLALATFHIYLELVVFGARAARRAAP